MITRFVRRSAALMVPALMIACASDGAVTPPPAGGDWTLDAAGLAALPELTIAEGRLVCTADGILPCPTRQAFANLLGPDRFALWEPGRQVQVWDKSDTPVTVAGVGMGLGQYETALAVGPADRDGIDIIDLGMQGLRLMRYDRSGSFLEEVALPQIRVGEARGFTGKVPVLQGMTADGPQGSTMFRVQILDAQTDTTGRVVLELPIPWLQLAGDSVRAAPPLYATAPVYGLFQDAEVVWSTGATFELSRRMADGTARWTLRGSLPRTAITEGEIAARKDAVRQMMGEGIVEAELEAMVAKSETEHPAIAGLTTTRDGTVYVAGPVTAAPTVEVIRLAPSGQPNARIVLPKETRILIAAGDSILVHRPVIGEQSEVRWLRLGATP